MTKSTKKGRGFKRIMSGAVFVRRGGLRRMIKRNTSDGSRTNWIETVHLI